MKTITKAEVVEARQRVSDSAQALEALAHRNLNGLSNEQMVDVELESIHLATERDMALKEYQDLLHRFYHQERSKDASATEDGGAAEKDTI